MRILYQVLAEPLAYRVFRVEHVALINTTPHHTEGGEQFILMLRIQEIKTLLALASQVIPSSCRRCHSTAH